MRDKVLEIYLSRNTFDCQPHATKSNRIDKLMTSYFNDNWRLTMGEHLRHLRRINRFTTHYALPVDHEEYPTIRRFFFADYYLTLVRGIVAVRHYELMGGNEEQDRCVCWLSSEIRASAGHDGRVLLGLLQQLCEVADSACLQWNHCSDCNRDRLVDLTPGDRVAS